VTINNRQKEIMSNKKPFPIGDILKWLCVILTIIAGIYIIDSRMEDRINEKLKDPKVLSKIASLVRPSFIFNHKGNIISDSGGEQFIKDIDVQMGNRGEPKIIIYPKEHLNSAPILECINKDYYIASERINKSDWLFKLTSENVVIMGGSPKNKELLFRLEIIK